LPPISFAIAITPKMKLDFLAPHTAGE
jgi:hypothetical protein